MKKYPEIEKANSMLRRLAMMGFCDRYEGEEHVSLAMQQLVEELIAVERQGSASGYYLLYTALNAIDAKPKDFLFCGHTENSIIMYSLGFSDVNPVNVSQENPLYYEFILWGSDRDPAFELKVSAELMNRLVEYFKDHNADGLLKAKYIEGDKQLWVSMDQGETVSRDSFSMLFMTMEKEQCLQIRTDYNDICEKCCPETYKDKIRCFGLAIGTGAWENNAKQLLSSGQVSFDEVITCREDVYEFLLKHGIKRQEAYSIAEDVRKGKIHVNGWEQNDLDMLKAANVAEWFIESCRKIKNLGTRMHEMIYYKRYIESIEISEGK